MPVNLGRLKLNWGANLLNPHYCFVGTWIVVLALYGFGWSSFNSALNPMLVIFFAIAIAFSLLAGGILPKTKDREGCVFSLRICRLITTAITIVTFADFAYQGGIPSFSNKEYVGYDIRYGASASVGIPLVHVVLVSFSLFYSFFLAYCAVYSRKDRGKFFTLYAITVVLISLMGSRSFVMFCLLSIVLLAINRSPKSLKTVRVRDILFSIIVIVSILFLFGVYGNIRSGYDWDDSSMILSLGSLKDYPDWLPGQFAWAYSYATSTLANLNLNVIYENHYQSIVNLASYFLPTTLTKGISAPTGFGLLYYDHHLNASTAFSGVYSSFGIAGFYIYFFFQLAYFSLLDRIYQKTVVGQSLGRMILSFFALLSCFYDPYTNVALCMAPLYLAFYSIYKSGKVGREVRSSAKSFSSTAANRLADRGFDYGL